MSLKVPGLCVLRILQKTVVKGLLFCALPSDTARQKAHHRIAYGHGRDLSAGHDKVPQRDDLIRIVEYSGVKAFIMTADQHQVILPGKLPCFFLVERHSGRVQQNHMAVRFLCCPYGIHHRLTAENHSRSSAVGGIVNLPEAPVGKIPDIRNPEVQPSCCPGPADDRFSPEIPEEFRKHGENINSHGIPLSCICHRGCICPVLVLRITHSTGKWRPSRPPFSNRLVFFILQLFCPADNLRKLSSLLFPADIFSGCRKHHIAGGVQRRLHAVLNHADDEAHTYDLHGHIR